MSIDKDRVLRLNCPGYGEESYLNLGQAKSLEHYQVIIANPVSLLHLFDKGPEAARRINHFLQEGINQLNVPDDALIQELINESDARLEELIPFLTQGGLLIYFLCRPFILAGPTISVDNYDWLSVYAPSAKVPEGKGPRQMSAVSHGRIVEPTEEGELSEMAEYLHLPGIEWNTIIRTDFLSSNYSVLATAGPKKCIAAQFWAGDKGGKVIFLPAPYSPDFDKVLMEGVNKWYQNTKPGSNAQSSPTPKDSLDLSQLVASAEDSLKILDQIETPKSDINIGTAPLTEPTPPAQPTVDKKTEVKQAPKGALKSLFANKGLLDDDDDDELEPSAPAAASPEVAKVTAEDILKSVSMEAERLSKEFESTPPAVPQMEAVQAQVSPEEPIAAVTPSETMQEPQDRPPFTLAAIATTSTQTPMPLSDEVKPPMEQADLAIDDNLDLDKIIMASMELSKKIDDQTTLVQDQPQVAPPAAAPTINLAEVIDIDPSQTSTAALPADNSNAAVAGFELKRATADMDLSEFAETARQLVQQANEIESATREPGKPPVQTPMTKINEQLKQSESNTPLDVSEAIDVTSEPVISPSMLEQLQMVLPTADVKAESTPEEAQNQLLNGMIKDMLIQQEEEESNPKSSPSAPIAGDITPQRPDKPATSMSMDEFRQTFEFLKEEEGTAAASQAAAEAGEVQAAAQPFEMQQKAGADQSEAPDIFAAPVESEVRNSEGRGSLRSIVQSLGQTGLPESTAKAAGGPAWLSGPESSAPATDQSAFDATSTQESIPALDVAQEIIQPTYQAELLGQPDLLTPTPVKESASQPETPAVNTAPATFAPAVPAAAPEPPATFAPALPASLPTQPELPPLPASLVAEEPAPPVPTPPAVIPQAAAPVTEPVKEMQHQPAPDLQAPQALPAPPVSQAPPMMQQPALAPPLEPPKPAPAPAWAAAPNKAPAFTPPAAPQPEAKAPPAFVAPPPAPSPTVSPGNGNGSNSNQTLPPLPDLQEDPDSHSPAKELMIKMEELTQTMNLTWTQDFSFPYVDALKGEHGQMMEQLRQMQLRISALDSRIRAIEGLKHVLLTGESDPLLAASQEVLSRLGWTVSPSRSNPGELWLSRGDQIDAIARVVRSPGAANRSEIAQLAESVIAFWDEYEIEPKGILLAQTWFSKTPAERTDPDFTPALQEFAGKKNLCLMSSLQLLGMYKDLEMGGMPVEEMRKRMLETNGRLMGFTLDNNVAPGQTV
ncbi:MAG: hypothetical protein HY986_19055 [Candidatus Melainabacteria bacterium]|nr:hypothetical protein [Candidatus Melainabacteria bacterium]